MMIALDPCIENMEIISKANQKILDFQIELKGRLLKRNTEKEMLWHAVKALKVESDGKRVNS